MFTDHVVVNSNGAGPGSVPRPCYGAGRTTLVARPAERTA